MSSNNAVRTKVAGFKSDPNMANVDLFTLAAWAHAQSFMVEHNYVPDVMVLGRYEDEQLMFVFPSSQDKALFAQACIDEAAKFNADIAMLVGEAEWREADATEGDGTPIVKVLWRERNQPIRAQTAVVTELPTPHGSGPERQRAYGPVSGVAGVHSHEILDCLWPGVVH